MNNEYMYVNGAMYPGALDVDGEPWRLFSAMFLHFGVEHLINNMLIFVLLAFRLEPVIGHLSLLIIYFTSGIVANLVSYEVMMYTKDYVISAGASGAVFGVIGALIPIIIINKGRLGDLRLRGVTLMAALSLYYGFTTDGIDNVCHITGLVTGIVLGAIIGKVIDFKTKNQYT
ncbi:MAG: rhomboid family intramembrane serine protease [Lachnospiraceae bacterium]|nr:rhomboid family intramembrane serine protease [Lachnospiraceae bacterium]